jgi:hypothetical protein
MRAPAFARRPGTEGGPATGRFFFDFSPPLPRALSSVRPPDTLANDQAPRFAPQ